MNLDVTVLNFFDLILIVVVPIVVMLLLTRWLVRHGCDRLFLVGAWAAFLVLELSGIVCLSMITRMQLTYWTDYLKETVRGYAIAVEELNHHTLVPGDAPFSSDYSGPVAPIVAAEWPSFPQEKENPAEISRPAHRTLTAKLAVPSGVDVLVGKPFHMPEHLDLAQQRDILNRWNRYTLAVFKKREGDASLQLGPLRQTAVRWQPVPGATTYRVQCAPVPSGDAPPETSWITVYSGSRTHCLLALPERPLLYRVRAENGTPEDDPTYLELLELCTRGVAESKYIGGIYSMRFLSEDMGIFILSANYELDGSCLVDPDKRPALIGEFYPSNETMRDLYLYQEAKVNDVPYRDDWGAWVGAFEPIFAPDGTFDGAVGIDFPVDVWYGSVHRAKFWPLCFFTVVSFLFFWGVWILAMLRKSSRHNRQYALNLQESIEQLTASRRAAEVAIRAKGHFLANMSHEIRTPMNAILGFIDIIGRKLLKRCPPDELEQNRETLDLMARSGNNLLEIINDILDFSKVDEGQVQLETIAVSVRKLLENLKITMLERFEEKAEIALLVSTDASVPEWIESDPTRIRQTLFCLLDNAFKFTKRGSIRLACTCPAEDVLLFTVEDTGIGISAELREHLFRPFMQADTSMTRSYGGAGLGLPIAKKLAMLLGGDVALESRPGEGSTFRFSMKCVATNAPKKAEGAEPTEIASVSEAVRQTGASRPLSGMTLLVADDGRVNQVVLEARLAEYGATIQFVDNGRRAVEEYEESVASGNRFDAILMDMQMPVMDGYEATRILRGKGCTLPIIAVTGETSRDEKRRTVESGCDHCFSKPINFERLVTLLAHYKYHQGNGEQGAGNRIS